MNFFAYGTLRPGASRHELIQGSVVGTADAVIEARLFVLSDGEPIVLEGEPAYPVQGSLLILPDSPRTLERLDDIEGSRHPHSPYLRVQRRIISDRGDEMAWIYVCKADETYRVLSEGTEITAGDWLAYSMSRD